MPIKCSNFIPPTPFYLIIPPFTPETTTPTQTTFINNHLKKKLPSINNILN